MDKVRKFFDDFALAGRGVLLAFKRKEFLIGFFVTFFVFGTLLNLLSTGTSSLVLVFSGDFSLAGKVLGQAFLANFGVGKEIGDFLLNFALTIMQSALVGMITIVWRHNRNEASSVGIVAGLVVLGSGCPTCGTTLLAPVVAMVVSGATGIAGTISMVLNIIAIVIGLLVFRKVGVETYAIIKSEKFKEEHEKSR